MLHAVGRFLLVPLPIKRFLLLLFLGFAGHPLSTHIELLSWQATVQSMPLALHVQSLEHFKAHLHDEILLARETLLRILPYLRGLKGRNLKGQKGVDLWSSISK